MADYFDRYLDDGVLSISTPTCEGDQDRLLTEIAMVHESGNPHREIDERVNEQVP